jgi:hypothetical protein
MAACIEVTREDMTHTKGRAPQTLTNMHPAQAKRDQRMYVKEQRTFSLGATRKYLLRNNRA